MTPAFASEAVDGDARTGALTTAHGPVRTPAFMPVGTHATVKALHPDEVRATGVDILLCNAYHLALRPGIELIERAGGAVLCSVSPGGGSDAAAGATRRGSSPASASAGVQSGAPRWGSPSTPC